jgi:hypothetical protein
MLIFSESVGDREVKTGYVQSLQITKIWRFFVCVKVSESYGSVTASKKVAK